MSSMAVVILLLVLFYMATTNQHSPFAEPYVKLASSTSWQCRMESSHSLTISVDAQNRVYLAADEPEFQTALIVAVAQQYGVSFTSAQLQELQQMPFLSQDIMQLPAWLNAFPAQRAKFAAGIPAGLANNQLSDYIASSLKVSQALYNKPTRFAIRADKSLSFRQVKTIIRLLQHHGINRFGLVNALNSRS